MRQTVELHFRVNARRRPDAVILRSPSRTASSSGGGKVAGAEGPVEVGVEIGEDKPEELTKVAGVAVAAQEEEEFADKMSRMPAVRTSSASGHRQLCRLRNLL